MTYRQLKHLVITMGFIILLMSGTLVGLIIFKPSPSDISQVPAFGMEGLASIDLAPRAGHRLYALTVFASWCAPCRAEMPYLTELSKHMSVYGIAVQDQPADLEVFLTQYGNPFVKIGYDYGGIMKDALGAGGIPETMIVDHTGTILYRHMGMLKPSIIADHILPLMDNYGA